MNITNTASASGSLLTDLQIGGTSIFKVDNLGRLTLAGQSITTNTSFLGITGTWNSSGTAFAGALRVSISSTASQITSLLFDFLLGAASVFNLDRLGRITHTGQSLGSGLTTPYYSLTGTWNDASTTFTAMKINITNTNSASGSKLLDLQIGSATKFNVDKSGNVSYIGLINNPSSSGIALGAGSTATLGATGGSGPAAAAQNQWLQVQINGSNFFIPVWT